MHFCIGGDRDGVVQVCWLMVKNHAHAAHGTIEFARSEGWRSPHSEPVLQRMVERYLDVYLTKKGESRSTIPDAGD